MHRQVAVLYALIATVTALAGCAAPCQSAVLVAGFQGEMKQCVDMSQDEAAGLECFARVEAEYAPKFKADGTNIADVISDLLGEVGAK